MSADSRSDKGVVDLIINDEDLRIVMLGKTGAGKSRSANTILGHRAFDFKCGGQSVTENCKKDRAEVNDRKVSVVDTPGLYDTKLTPEQTIQEIKRCICFAAPGPHVFMFVIKLGRFTVEEQKTVKMVGELFGEMSTKYTMILFTGGDDLEDEGRTIEEVLEDTPQLNEFVRECDGRYHVFNNKIKNPSQVTELLEKINNMVLKNGGSHYTNEMFQDAERAIEEESQKNFLQMMVKLEKKYKDLVPLEEVTSARTSSRVISEEGNAFTKSREVAKQILEKVGEFLTKPAVLDKVGELVEKAIVKAIPCSIL